VAAVAAVAAAVAAAAVAAAAMAAVAAAAVAAAAMAAAAVVAAAVAAAAMAAAAVPAVAAAAVPAVAAAAVPAAAVATTAAVPAQHSNTSSDNGQSILRLEHYDVQCMTYRVTWNETQRKSDHGRQSKVSREGWTTACFTRKISRCPCPCCSRWRPQ